MPSAVAAQRDVVVRHPKIPVLVPVGATQQQEAALVAQALYQAYTAAARRAGAQPLPAEVERPWERAAAYPPGPPSPSSAETVPEFLDRMRALKRWARISFEALEQRAKQHGHALPHSTMNRLLSRSNVSRLPDGDQLAAFVLSCGLSEEQSREWASVWAEVQSIAMYGDSTPFPALLERTRSRFHNVSSRALQQMLAKDPALTTTVTAELVKLVA
jgi:hypothetical protein